MKVVIETSARHVHVTREALDILYGKGYQLTPKKMLTQPGQFACEERVAVVGSKGQFPKVSILGPERPVTQVELSMTDARSIGVNAPLRESGKIEGSGSCKLVGPAGEIELKEGVMVAKRHLHATPEDAEAMGIHDKQIIQLKVDTDGRSLIFGDVLARVSKTCATFVHIDTDEANAAGIAGEVKGEVIL